MRALDFGKARKANPSMADLKIIQNRIDKDFDQNKDSRVNIAQEQVEDFGKADKGYPEKNSPTFRNNVKKNITPSIYDLMKKKEEKDKQITGRDIELD